MSSAQAVAIHAGAAMLPPEMAGEELANDNSFAADMAYFFSRKREAHISERLDVRPIGFWGYVSGGEYYSKWLEKNDPYRSQIILEEHQLMANRVSDLADICVKGCGGEVKTVVQAGTPGSVAGFLTETYLLLDRISAQQNTPPKLAIADISAASFRNAQGFIKNYAPQFTPEFIEGNFFGGLPVLPKGSVLLIPRLTWTNPPFDIIKNGVDNVLHRTSSDFRRVLGNGGVLICSYANDNGIDPQGKAVKIFYDDPLIHAYQLSIFKRVEQELLRTGDAGNYDHRNFGIRHEWRAGEHTLTRHATIRRPMQFGFGGCQFDLLPADFKGDGGYMSNNVRPPDHKVQRYILGSGFDDCHIFGSPNKDPRDTNMRLVAAVNYG